MIVEFRVMVKTGHFFIIEMINITRSQVAPSSQGIEGSTLTMSVDINIRFGFDVKWLRNGTQVSHSPGRFLIQQSFIDVMKCSLDILELKLRDQGKNFRTLMFNGCLIISNVKAVYCMLQN